MKLTRLLTRLPTSLTKSPFQAISGITWYSTKTTVNPKRNTEELSLYRRISPVGNPNDSIVPVLDQWVQEGRSVTPYDLHFIIKELRHYRRFKHALEISQWMTDKRFMHVTAGDAAVRLDLIAKVHGVEEAENYFNNTPTKLRTLEVYGALLNCYSRVKCVEKAENVMQKMRDMGFAASSIHYNVLLNLYCRTDNREKLDALIHEMEAKQKKFDCYTYSILLNAYGGVSDIDGMEKILGKMESDQELDIDWRTYAVAARLYLKAGLVDKALRSLRKSEKLIYFTNKRNEAFSYILPLYASAGEKEEVLRVWKECKLCKVTNRDYMSVLPVILEFFDIETAEKIFSEWESSALHKDIRIPQFLIKAYCKQGLMEKAEDLLGRAKMRKWAKPDVFTWSWMSIGYVKNNQMAKAVEVMEFALSEFNHGICWEPSQETLAACLKYLKDEGAEDRFHALVELLKDKGFLPVEIHQRLLKYLDGECAIEDVF